MKKFLTILLAGVMTLSLTACSSKKDEPTPGQNTNQVEGATPAATSDGIDPSGYKGTVMLYSSTGEDVVIALKNAFEAKYPNIKLDYYAATSGKCVTKLATEFQSGTVACDLAWLAPQQ